MQLWNWRGLDVINAHERDPRVYVDGMHAAAQAVADGQLDPNRSTPIALPWTSSALPLTRCVQRPDVL